MFNTAFSTVACPDWTLDRVARFAAEHGYDGVELRSFGYGSTAMACDPALTSPQKIRSLFTNAGVRVACIATGARFDAPIRPLVIGRVISDNEVAVRQAKAAIDLAAQIECPLVRVFGFEFRTPDQRATTVSLIVERLRLVADAARHSGVRVVLENGGSFTRAADLLDLIGRVGSPLLGAAYSAAVAHASGEDPAAGVRELGPVLWSAKIKDYAHNTPCPLGEGDVPNASFVAALTAQRFEGWLIYEWDRLWLPSIPPPEPVLAPAVKRMYEWAGAGIRRVAAPRVQHA